jgi:hypothetical protein
MVHTSTSNNQNDASIALVNKLKNKVQEQNVLLRLQDETMQTMLFNNEVINSEILESRRLSFEADLREQQQILIATKQQAQDERAALIQEQLAFQAYKRDLVKQHSVPRTER